MTAVKTIELTTSSPEGFGRAIELGVARASETGNVRGVWIKNQEAIFKDGQVAQYRVCLRPLS